MKSLIRIVSIIISILLFNTIAVYPGNLLAPAGLNESADSELIQMDEHPAPSPYADGEESGVTRRFEILDKHMHGGRISERIRLRISIMQKPKILLIGIGRGTIAYDLLKEYGSNIELFSIAKEELLHTPASLARQIGKGLTTAEADGYLRTIRKHYEITDIEQSFGNFEEERFDLVIMTQAVMEHIKDQIGVLNRMKSHLAFRGEYFAEINEFELFEKPDKLERISFTKFLHCVVDGTIKALEPQEFFESLPGREYEVYGTRTNPYLHVTNKRPENCELPLARFDITDVIVPHVELIPRYYATAFNRTVGFAHMTFPGLVYELILNAKKEHVGIFLADTRFGNRLFMGFLANIGSFAGTVSLASRIRLESRFKREMGPIVTLEFYLTLAQIKEAGIYDETGEPYAAEPMPLSWATPQSKLEYLNAVLTYLDDSHHHLSDEDKRRLAKALGYEEIYIESGWEAARHQLQIDSHLIPDALAAAPHSEIQQIPDASNIAH